MLESLTELAVPKQRDKMDRMTVMDLRRVRRAAIRHGYDHCAAIIGHYLVLSGRDKNADRPDYPAHCELTRADDRFAAIVTVVASTPPLLTALFILGVVIVKIITG